MSRYKDIFKSGKVILLLIFLVFSYITIQPQLFGNEGATIRSVETNSSADLAGIEEPSPKSSPLSKEKIIFINGEKVSNENDYYEAVSNLKPDRKITLETNKDFYKLETKFNDEGNVNLGLKVYTSPTSNLRKGLDLEGGTRVLLAPVLKEGQEVSNEDLDITISSLKERLNVYGLSDVVVRSAKDLSGEVFILVEIAGVTENEVKELLSKQGKFEAKIGNETVFFGGKKDITYVCRSAECSGIDPRRGCSKSGEGEFCNFFFSITLSPEAAERQAKITNTLTVLSSEGDNSYLSKDLELFLDDVGVDSLRIGADLQGKATTQIQISGSGVGRTREEAVTNTLENMKKLQTVLITGSLPIKLEIVKLDTVSPTLGQEFLDNILLVGLLVIMAVITVVLLRYKTMKIVVPMVATLFSEMALILGFAALVGWNLDLAAIAGIIIVAGTGVDHLIIITDGALRGGGQMTNWKQKIKNAMSIVFGAYMTTLVGMMPLLWAGAGLLKGFALTTIAGISFGVLIARPAYAIVIEKLLRE